MSKVSLYINEEVWAKFREEVFRKYGSLRKLSNEVEALLRSTLIEDAVKSGFRKMGIEAEGIISSREVKEKRPLLMGLASEEIIRKMRDKRIAEALSRISHS